MGRRARYTTPPGQHFHRAFDGIDTLERKVISATVTPAFTLDDVATMLWPPHVVASLKSAFQYIATGDRTSWALSTDPDKAAVHAAFGNINAMTLRMPVCMMCSPAHGQVVVNQLHPAFNKVMATLDQTYAIVQRFEKVRRIIRWFNEKEVSPGAGRYLFPGVLALVPADHPAHSAGGIRYQEPRGNTAEIVPTIREASATVAEATLCFDREKDDENALNVRFNADNPNGYSNMFTLL